MNETRLVAMQLGKIMSENGRTDLNTMSQNGSRSSSYPCLKSPSYVQKVNICYCALIFNDSIRHLTCLSVLKQAFLDQTTFRIILDFTRSNALRSFGSKSCLQSSVSNCDLWYWQRKKNVETENRALGMKVLHGKRSTWNWGLIIPTQFGNVDGTKV